MCAGYGGIGLGLKNIFGERLRTIAYCELEGFAQANLISKMEKGLLDAAPIWNDLKTFPYESFHGLVDIIIAGYPCQPFSSAGKRAGKEDPRHLWPWIADGIRLLQPTMCFFENVEGHISLGLSTVISDLEELGYKVSWGIFSAREVGAPHQRKRLFIMAHSELPFPARLKRICGEFGALTETERNQTYIGGANAWPSRPGQQQYAWEPPRVVGNASSKRSCGGSEDGANQQSEMPWKGYEAVGDSECIRIPTTREHGAMDEASGIPADREGCESAQADPESSATREREGDGGNAAERSKVECEVGRDAYESSIGMDLSELSGLSNSELAEICEWMVKGENRTDELRLLGNGVVPATATRAFLTLIEELNK